MYKIIILFVEPQDLGISCVKSGTLAIWEQVSKVNIWMGNGAKLNNGSFLR